MKNRLDTLMVQNGLAGGRDRAKALVMAGHVYVNGVRADKAGTMVAETDDIDIRGGENPYVSRGGLKLEKAMRVFAIDLNGKTCMDVGASTGGFTDCMLKNGAERVYAVDVGYGQLAWKLRGDIRVCVMERTNIRNIRPQDVDVLDFASVDVSFISLSLVLPVVNALLSAEGGIVCLIKPQFEAGRGKVGKNGVVRDIQVHIEVARKIYDFALGLGLFPVGFDFSPVKGPQGNIEYLMYLRKTGPCLSVGDVSATVERSHEEL